MPAPCTAKFINILAEEPHIVAGWLVPRIRYAGGRAGGRAGGVAQGALQLPLWVRHVKAHLHGKAGYTTLQRPPYNLLCVTYC